MVMGVGGGGASGSPTPVTSQATAKPQANPENRVVDRSPPEKQLPKKRHYKIKIKTFK